MALILDQDSKPFAQFTVPTKGTWNTIAAHNVPLDALYSSLNVFIREGKLRNRPGLSMLNNTTFASPIIGAKMGVTPTEKRVLAVSTGHLYELGEYDTAWTDRATLTFSNSDKDLVDITFLQASGTYFALIAQQQFALKQWTLTGGPVNVTATVGTVPFAKSVCISARRVIALVAPHTVVWSRTFDHTAWDATSTNTVAQTNDVGVCVRSISNLAYVLYKERSIYPVRAQAGDNATAFAFGEPIEVEGPAGLHSVVKVNGTHIYMTKNGRIALFDGARYPQWICDGLWLYLQRDIDAIFAKTIHGVYDYRLHCIIFFYPKVGDGGMLKGMVIVNLPLEGTDIAQVQGQQPSAFLGYLSKPCSRACEVRFDTAVDRSLLFTAGVADSQSFTLDENVLYDDGLEYICSHQTGLVSLPDAKHGRIAVETFLERGANYGAVLVEGVHSDQLENKEGTVYNGQGQYIDLETNPVREYKGFNTPSRFFGLKYTWSSRNIVRYSGAVAYNKGIA